MSREFEYTVTKKITDEQIVDLIIDGIESGTTYWAFIHNDTPEFQKCYEKDLCTSEAIAEIILNGGEVKITDLEDSDNPKYKLTLERLLKGIQLNAEQRPWDSDLNNYDSGTSDAIIQYALYDELVFG